MGILFKALIGALVVVLIGVLAKTRNYYIAGLVPLFPTFALIAHYIVGSERSIAALKTTLIFGMWAVLPYLVYLISLYFLLNSLRLSLALAAAVLCWIAAAWLLITLWGWWQGR
ncbi:GlpM family protein [Serratia ficaria]|uniref:GlpM family protein n=1 Tax=Serratia ficaria TaxID=61651 RepID=UPI00077CC14D|nr:GlpM family protein [Serratia ficaria]MEE4484143.1 GlpM family protein [Serratia ficaria]CAI0693845.1 Inner membrane protein ydgC [Serratia ficaria]CAI0841677.1 Inner membrane protein ydgC [Serratia ficaria]CAI1053836.1 Inner membrane protein ydgC [Serratia ficaria]CAI1519696.1 Inner membrane protein ydgC [Serratia ficaria]